MSAQNVTPPDKPLRLTDQHFGFASEGASDVLASVPSTRKQ
jgi:hypothetical protein